MQKVYPMHIVDPNAEYRGVSVTKLMDRAGKEALKAIEKKWSLRNKKVQIFCGSGNNGGDGFALAAELLEKKIEVEVILAVNPQKIRTEAARHHFARLPKKILKRYIKQTPIDGDIIVDALLGIGVDGKLKPPFTEIVRKIARSKKPIVSLDVPTGNLKPKLVVAFHSSKSPLDPPFVKGGKRGRGVEVVVTIGIPKIAETHFGPGDIQVYFPERESKSHKGDNGRVIVIGGSKDYVGAPVFAALGAVSGGADLVYLFVPKNNFVVSRKFTPNILVKSFAGDSEKLTPEAVSAILNFAKKNKAAIVLGPGLGQNVDTKEAVKKLVKNFKGKGLVLDADALIPDLPTPNPNTNTILTPHAGEFKKLGSRISQLGTVILRKGAIDTITSPTQTRYNDSGSAVLTTGGTGDTLAGFVGAMLARNVPPFEAAGISAFLIGKAAEELALKYESITPQLLSKQLPKTIQYFLTRNS
jgi:hydroxyethylthiazole kinase-like uncharacterized protein yjeF